MNPDRLRVGDAERDVVTSALHEHFARGRLTRDELDERVETTLSAKTVADLRSVLRDLPGSPETATNAPPDSPWPPYGPDRFWWHPHGHHGHRSRRERDLAAYGMEERGLLTHGLLADGPLTRARHGQGPLTHGPHGWHPLMYGPHGHGPAGWGPHGWGPRRGRPFGLILLAVVIAAAVTGTWVIFPFLGVMWFGGAFLMTRNARRRHHADRRPGRRRGSASRERLAAWRPDPVAGVDPGAAERDGHRGPRGPGEAGVRRRVWSGRRSGLRAGARRRVRRRR